MEALVNSVIAFGFIILVLGVGLWIFSLSQRFNLSAETLLVIFGCVLLIFGTLAARLFSRVGT